MDIRVFSTAGRVSVFVGRDAFEPPTVVRSQRYLPFRVCRHVGGIFFLFKLAARYEPARMPHGNVHNQYTTGYEMSNSNMLNFSNNKRQKSSDSKLPSP